MANEIKQVVEDRIRALLEKLHFTSFDRNGVFAREDAPGVFDLFGLVIQEAAPGVRISPNIGVRHAIVADIFHRTSLWDKRFIATAPTFGSSLGLIKDGDLKNPNSYLIEIGSLAEVETTLEEIARIYEEYAVPYFEKYRSLKVIDSNLNDEPGAISIHCMVPWLHWSTGIIIAKLVNRSNYTQLTEFYVNCARRSNNGFYWPRFESLLKDLETNVQPF